MMLEQAPKPPQLPDGLVVRSGDDGPAAEEQPPHVLGNGDSGGRGLLGYSFIFLDGKPERPSLLKSGCRLPLFHLPFLPFCEREKQSAERSLESRGEAFGRMPAVVRQLPSCKEELSSVSGTLPSRFGWRISCAMFPLLEQA